MNFIAIAIFYHFYRNAIGKLGCFGVRPRAYILFPAYANFWVVGAAHRNVAAGGAHDYTRARGDRFGRDFQVVVVGIPAEIAELQVASGKFALYSIDANHDADEK